MKITRLLAGNHRHYFIDGEFVTHDLLDEICKKYLTVEGLTAFWRKLCDDGECTLDLDFDFSEKNILEIKKRRTPTEKFGNCGSRKKVNAVPY